MQIIDTETGDLVQQISWPQAYDPAMSADGSMVAVEGVIAPGGAGIDIFRTADSWHLTRYKGSGEQITWDPRGRFVAFARGDTLHLWNYHIPETAEQTILLRSPIQGVAFTTDGNRLMVGNDDHLTVFEITGE